MANPIKKSASATVFGLLLVCLGCGSGLVFTGGPSIDQILPQTIVAGSKALTMKVTGTNFSNKVVLLWNNTPVATSVIDSNTLTGAISSSSIANPSTVQLQVENTDTQSESQSVSLIIAPPVSAAASTLVISSNSLPPGVAGSPFSTALAATGGTPPYAWTISSGQLPAGLALSPSGIISGTPLTSGSSSFLLTVSDSSPTAQSATTSLTATVNASITPPPPTPTPKPTPTPLPPTPTPTPVPPVPTPTPIPTPALPLAVLSSALPQATNGSFYSTSLHATGGTAPYLWSISSGNFPSGLALTPATGAISGTPSGSGIFTFAARVSDASNPVQSASATITLTIAPSILTISSSTLPAATMNVPYSGVLQATGGTTPYLWNIASGALPNGLTLDKSTGSISGAPAASGTANFTVSVTDGSSPAQTVFLTTSIAVAPVTLAISSSTLAAGVDGAAYSANLQATGGAAPYNWVISTGSLPAGLTLSGNTGLISGTPSTSGTSSFTATVTDASSPTQSKSAAIMLTLASAALSITTSTLSPGTNGTAYSVALQAAGGTPAYTWAISGSLPAGLTLAATTGIISGTPTATGSSTFTATVTDNSTPAQSKSVTASINIAASAAPAGPGTTWYIRKDGGTRYSANQPLGQCDGKGDNAYSGTGTNQHCAFNDYRFLYDDQSYGNSAWVIAGGDTVILRGGPWRVGYGTNDTTNRWCFGQNGGPYGCTNPPIPAGTANQHTQILGQNYASCGSQANETQLFGGFGLQIALNLRGAQYVDVKCIELTRHSQCITHGYPQLPMGCNTSYPGEDDYAGDGIFTDVNTHDLLLQDMWIHGFTDRGIIGPIGGMVTATRVDIAYNGMAGWDFDDGTGSNNGNGTASVNGVWNLNQTTIEWNGCNQEYPIVDQYPATSCYSQSTGGYGDGVGTPPGTCLAANIIGSSFHNNTQDGLDLGHGDTGTNCPLTIKDSTAYANNGGTFKWGPNENPLVFENNLALANCLRMSQPITGAPISYNANLSDFCRASDAISFAVRQNGTATLANNTVVSYAPTTFDIQCWDAPGAGSPGDTGVGCGNSSVTLENNLVLGYDNPTTYNQGGQSGGPGLLYLRDPIGSIVRNNNLYSGIGHGFNCSTGYSGETCQAPQFINQPTRNASGFVESELDNFNFNISIGSPAGGAGRYIPSLTLDYSGVHRPDPPSVGALEPQ